MYAQRRVTSKDVAERAGVSRTTVSFVLNDVPGVRISDDTRQKVLRAARELNYYPNAAARSLASRKTRRIGLVLCQNPERIFVDAFLPEVLRGIGDVAQAEEFRVLLQSVENVAQPEAYTHLVGEKQIDGIILSGPRSDDSQLLALRKEGFPVVLLGQLEGSEVPFVDVDSVGGARVAVEHLIGHGHERIGLITNAPPQYTASAQREQGYRQALEEHRLTYDRGLVRYGDFNEESGWHAMSELLEVVPLPTAVFAASDLVAFGAMEAAKARGLKIPHDLALAGFDDVPLARYLDPPLTTIRLPAYGLGAGAGRMLLRLIKGEETRDTQLFLETELVIRDSCGFHEGATLERSIGGRETKVD